MSEVSTAVASSVCRQAGAPIQPSHRLWRLQQSNDGWRKKRARRPRPARCSGPGEEAGPGVGANVAFEELPPCSAPSPSAARSAVETCQSTHSPPTARRDTRRRRHAERAGGAPSSAQERCVGCHTRPQSGQRPAISRVQSPRIACMGIRSVRAIRSFEKRIRPIDATLCVRCDSVRASCVVSLVS